MRIYHQKVNQQALLIRANIFCLSVDNVEIIKFLKVQEGFRRFKKVQGKLGESLGNVPKSFEIFLKGRFRGSRSGKVQGKFRQGSDKV